MAQRYKALGEDIPDSKPSTSNGLENLSQILLPPLTEDSPGPTAPRLSPTTSDYDGEEEEEKEAGYPNLETLAMPRSTSSRDAC